MHEARKVTITSQNNYAINTLDRQAEHPIKIQRVDVPTPILGGDEHKILYLQEVYMMC